MLPVRQTSIPQVVLKIKLGHKPDSCTIILYGNFTTQYELDECTTKGGYSPFLTSEKRSLHPQTQNLLLMVNNGHLHKPKSFKQLMSITICVIIRTDAALHSLLQL